jgi:hypothetical protein
MGSQAPPTTPVRVPKAVTTYTPTMQDPDLRSQINAVLLRDGHVETYVLPPLLPSGPNTLYPNSAAPVSL